MLNRSDRILPWAFFAGMLAVMLMGIAWDASFEATPAPTDNVSQGDDRIRELKIEIADRGEDELCWGTGATAGCPTGDSGFAREGSARAFFANANPTTLNNQAATALGANHDGRIYFDDDGADNVNANNDDNRVGVWDGAAWAFPRWESLGGITLTAIANGEILKYNGTVLVNQAVATLVTRDTANFADGETWTDGTCAADCTVTDVPDHTGGTDTNGYAEVTVPAAPSGVTWDIYVTGHLQYGFTSANNGNIALEIEYDINDADTFVNTLTRYGAGNASGNTNGRNDNFYFNQILAGATAGSAYSFRVKMTDNGAGTADWDSGTIGGGVSTSDFIRVEVRPRTVF